MKNFKTITTGVYARTGRPTLSANTFYFVMVVALIWGLLGTAIVANSIEKSGYLPDMRSVFALAIAFPLVGIIVALLSNNVWVSFVAYTFIIMPFAGILAPVLNQYHSGLIFNSFGITACTTVWLGVMGIAYPSFFDKFFRGAIIVGVCLGLTGIFQFMNSDVHLGVIDYVSSGALSLAVVYTMYRANSLTKTARSAIDVVIDMYLDIINLIFYLFKVIGKKRTE
ncbi:MAG: hypothetical protein NTY80_05420 [candidate division SR1 bacterium]|nr:hypothetical protein [candidate division SR1 bacterium]